MGSKTQTSKSLNNCCCVSSIRNIYVHVSASARPFDLHIRLAVNRINHTIVIYGLLWVLFCVTNIFCGPTLSRFNIFINCKIFQSQFFVIMVTRKEKHKMLWIFYKEILLLIIGPLTLRLEQCIFGLISRLTLNDDLDIGRRDLKVVCDTSPSGNANICTFYQGT